MQLFTKLFSEDIKEAKDLQEKIEHNQFLQKQIEIKINILRIAQKEDISEGEFEYFRSKEKRYANELRRLQEDNKRLQDDFVVSTNKVRLLQQATKIYENNFN